MTQQSDLMQHHASRRSVLKGSAGMAGLAVSGSSLITLLNTHAVGAQDEKSITWARGDDLRTQDPQEIAGLMEGTINRLLYEPLIDTDETQQLLPALATEWTMAEDGLSYTLKLRDGVTYHDGTAVQCRFGEIHFRSPACETRASTRRSLGRFTAGSAHR